MKKIVSLLLTAAAVFLIGSCSLNSDTGNLRFYNSSSGSVYNLNIGGEIAGTVASGQYSDYYELPAEWITVSWSYASGSTSYSFGLSTGDWQVNWNGTTSTVSRP